MVVDIAAGLTFLCCNEDCSVCPKYFQSSIWKNLNCERTVDQVTGADCRSNSCSPNLQSRFKFQSYSSRTQGTSKAVTTVYLSSYWFMVVDRGMLALLWLTDCSVRGGKDVGDLRDVGTVGSRASEGEKGEEPGRRANSTSVRQMRLRGRGRRKGTKISRLCEVLDFCCCWATERFSRLWRVEVELEASLCYVNYTHSLKQRGALAAPGSPHLDFLAGQGLSRWTPATAVLS